MEVNSVNSASSGVAQLVQQSPQQNQVRTASSEQQAGRAREQQSQQQAELVQKAAQPVVNTQGQVTGGTINTSA
ncbi:MAG: hypothetical protein Q8O37_13245 [Sulfuricellaceae bacterium]|nr:hypothetical protein [Sulfuricellaceae bacterium]